MPRFKTKPAKPPIPKGLGAALLREVEAEAKEWQEVSQATRLTYEANAERLATGWDMDGASQQTLCVMRASGLWTMRRELRATLRETKKLAAKIKAAKKQPAAAEDLDRFAGLAREMRRKLEEVRQFDSLPWNESKAPKGTQAREASHKKKPATDAELKTFFAHEWAQASPLRTAFLVAEIAGCRGQEFANGVRVTLCQNKQGQPQMDFYIESAKCDGKKKGLPLRHVRSVFNAKGDKDAARRWVELAKLVGAKKSRSLTVKVAPTKEERTVGQEFSTEFRRIARMAGADISAYSLRQRFSAQVKHANPGDAIAVALALGHQTTETQRHYARWNRHSGGVSPAQVTGINPGDHFEIRGPAKREGPARHSKEKAELARVTEIKSGAPPPRWASPFVIPGIPRGPRL